MGEGGSLPRGGETTIGSRADAGRGANAGLTLAVIAGRVRKRSP